MSFATHPVDELERKESLRTRGCSTGVMRSAFARARPGLLAVVATVAVLATACATPGPSLPQDSEFFAPDGSAATLARFEGQPVVLNFFASWCPPCIAELPEFEQVSSEFAGTVQFVGVNTDFDQDAWLRLVEETGVTYPTFFQPSAELFRASESPSMPTTVFLDADGVVQHTFAGRLTEETLRDLIGEHLLTPA